MKGQKRMEPFNILGFYCLMANSHRTIHANLIKFKPILKAHAPSTLGQGRLALVKLAARAKYLYTYDFHTDVSNMNYVWAMSAFWRSSRHSRVRRRISDFLQGCLKDLDLSRQEAGAFCVLNTKAGGSCSLGKQWHGVETERSTEKWLCFSMLNCLIFAPVSRLAGRSALVMLLPIASAQACLAVLQSRQAQHRAPF